MVRARPPNDNAYRSTNFSDLVASWDKAPTRAKEVLLGLRLSIIMPEGDCKEEAFEACRTLAAIASPFQPVELARAEVEDYLTAQEKLGLDKGHPVLFHHLVDRQRIPAGRGRPRLTDRLNRLADARQFMIAQALHHLGHLIAKERLSGARQAFDRSAERVIEDWWPHGLAGRNTPDALYDKLLATMDAGNHASVYGKFLVPGTQAIDQVLEVYRNFDFAKDAVEKATTYWLTVLRAGLLIEEVAQAQLNAHIRLSKTPQGDDYEPSDIVDFIRADGSKPSLDDLLPVAYYGVPDLGHIARWTSGLHNIYESAAAVGEIARGQRARVSHWQAALLLSAFDETQHPDPSISVGPTRYLSAFAFLRAAMTRARDASWWQSVLTSARVDNYGVRHIALSDEPGLSAAEFIERQDGSGSPEISPIVEVLIQATVRAGLGPIGELNEAGNLRLFGSVEGGGMWFNRRQHGRFGSDNLFWLEDSIAQCVSQMMLEIIEDRPLHLGRTTSPHCFSDHIAVAQASYELLKFLDRTPLPHHEIDLKAYARWLSDAETAAAKQRGQAAFRDLIARLPVKRDA
jgi:hypothetical protein